MTDTLATAASPSSGWPLARDRAQDAPPPIVSPGWETTESSGYFGSYCASPFLGENLAPTGTAASDLNLVTSYVGGGSGYVSESPSAFVSPAIVSLTTVYGTQANSTLYDAYGPSVYGGSASATSLHGDSYGPWIDREFAEIDSGTEYDEPVSQQSSKKAKRASAGKAEALSQPTGATTTSTSTNRPSPPSHSGALLLPSDTGIGGAGTNSSTSSRSASISAYLGTTTGDASASSSKHKSPPPAPPPAALRSASRRSKNTKQRRPDEESPRQRQARRAHNEVERNYRGRLNQGYADLLEAVRENERHRHGGGGKLHGDDSYNGTEQIDTAALDGDDDDAAAASPTGQSQTRHHQQQRQQQCYTKTQVLDLARAAIHDLERENARLEREHDELRRVLEREIAGATMDMRFRGPEQQDSSRAPGPGPGSGPGGNLV